MPYPGPGADVVAQRQPVGAGIDMLAEEVRHLLPGVDVAGRRQSGTTKSVYCGRLRRCRGRSPTSRLRGTAARLGMRADLVGADTGAGA